MLLSYSQNFAPTIDQVGMISAGMFSFVGEYGTHLRKVVYSPPSPAMAVMLYALWTYHWRAASIRRGGGGPYDEGVVPV